MFLKILACPNNLTDLWRSCLGLEFEVNKDVLPPYSNIKNQQRNGSIVEEMICMTKNCFLNDSIYEINVVNISDPSLGAFFIKDRSF